MTESKTIKKMLGCALIMISLCMATTSFSGSLQEQQFIWNEANTKMASAHTAEQFREAAVAYQKLVDIGVKNGLLFYNLGTALMMAEQYKDAMQTLLRAERYMGSNWDIKRNMLICSAGGTKEITPSLQWYRFPLFWHFGLSIQTRINVMILAFAAFWLALIFRILGFGRISKPLVILTLIVFMLFGSSVATSLHQESKAGNRFQVLEPRTRFGVSGFGLSGTGK
ncbi:tetratricopeptide repeat protein [Verrucomicrobiota bacterium]